MVVVWWSNNGNVFLLFIFMIEIVRGSKFNMNRGKRIIKWGE